MSFNIIKKDTELILPPFLPTFVNYKNPISNIHFVNINIIIK